MKTSTAKWTQNGATTPVSISPTSLNSQSKNVGSVSVIRFNHWSTPIDLGTIIFRFPRWFSPSDNKREHLAELRYRMGDLPVAVQFSNVDWVQPEFCESTFNYLEQLDLSFVCVDANDDDPRGLAHAAATTNDIGVVRLLGRKDHEEGDEWSPSWRGYRYSRSEMEQTAERLEYLAGSCKELHVLFCTQWRDDSVVNAELLQEVIGLRAPGLLSAG